MSQVFLRFLFYLKAVDKMRQDAFTFYRFRLRFKPLAVHIEVYMSILALIFKTSFEFLLKIRNITVEAEKLLRHLS